jgi:hypothetical protein
MAGLTGLEPATSSVTGWRSDLAELQPRKPETAWWAKQDSNLRPLPCKGSALPTELFARHPERGYYTTSPAGFVKGSVEGVRQHMGSIPSPAPSLYPYLKQAGVHRVDPKMPKQRGLLESPHTPEGSGGILPAKSPFCAPNKGGWRIPLSETTQGKPCFEHPQRF